MFVKTQQHSISIYFFDIELQLVFYFATTWDFCGVLLSDVVMINVGVVFLVVLVVFFFAIVILVKG